MVLQRRQFDPCQGEVGRGWDSRGRETSRISRLAIFGMKISAVLAVYLQTGLTHLVVLRSGYAFFDQSLIVAPSLLVLIGTGGRWRFVSGRAGHRVPAFGFGRRFKRHLFWVRVRFPRQLPLGLFPIGFRHLLRGAALMTDSSTARSRTILRVTVPMPAEFSVKTPSFNGFAFMGSSSPSVRECLGVMRRFQSGAHRNPPECRGILKKYCPAFRSLELLLASVVLVRA